MKKLWQKEKNKLDLLVEVFETKDDLVLDEKLIPFDIQGSLAHAKMLKKIGILTDGDLKKLKNGLKEILKLTNAGKFTLAIGDEDVHTKIENYLTEKYGKVGKKIHTARSRNDQVLAALRLFTKSKLANIQKETLKLIKDFKIFADKYGSIPMPGYTHMQKAMPSSISLWIESFISNLEDDLIISKSIYDLINQSPLGSAAGYGVPIEIDRKYTTKLLGFAKVQENPIYCQHSRGKFEALVLASLIQILLTINKFAADVMLFSTSEFNYLVPSSKITTGSSIMPQKKNLDLAELLRAKLHVVLGNYTQVVSLCSNLVSGYNRDLQDTKKPLIESLETTLESLKVTGILVSNLTPNKEKLKSSMTEDLYATEKALKLTLAGRNFRDSYQKIALDFLKREGGDKNAK